MVEFNTTVQDAKAILTTAATSIKDQLNVELTRVEHVITTEGTTTSKNNTTILSDQGAAIAHDLSTKLSTKYKEHTQSNLKAWAILKKDMTNSQTQLVNTNRIAIKNNIVLQAALTKANPSTERPFPFMHTKQCIILMYKIKLYLHRHLLHLYKHTKILLIQ